MRHDLSMRACRALLSACASLTQPSYHARSRSQTCDIRFSVGGWELTLFETILYRSIGDAARFEHAGLPSTAECLRITNTAVLSCTISLANLDRTIVVQRMGADAFRNYFISQHRRCGDLSMRA